MFASKSGHTIEIREIRSVTNGRKRFYVVVDGVVSTVCHRSHDKAFRSACDVVQALEAKALLKRSTNARHA
jgi:hypothetical protein